MCRGESVCTGPCTHCLTLINIHFDINLLRNVCVLVKQYNSIKAIWGNTRLFRRVSFWSVWCKLGTPKLIQLVHLKTRIYFIGYSGRRRMRLFKCSVLLCFLFIYCSFSWTLNVLSLFFEFCLFCLFIWEHFLIEFLSELNKLKTHKTEYWKQHLCLVFITWL